MSASAATIPANRPDSTRTAASVLAAIVGEAPGPAPWLGIEQEYRVLRDDHPQDFRELLPTLTITGDRLDPGDPNATRCDWGGVITADGAEAEVVAPPVEARAGSSSQMQAWMRAGAATLRRATRCELDGYSTHLSVEVDDDDVVDVARLYLRRYSPAMMLMLDRADSPGLLVRPRRGRLELCGEYACGFQLRAASVFAAASALHCAAVVAGDDRGALPPVARPRLEAARGRFGWYVDRGAFRDDLYAGGRAARVDWRGSAQRRLHISWSTARDTAVARFDADEIALVDAVVEGRLPLPCEEPACDPGHDAPAATPFPRILERTRRGISVRAEVATWSFTVFSLRSDGHDVFVSVPGRQLDAFLAALDAGRLDRWLVGTVRAPVDHGTLANADQTAELGVFSRVGPPDGLVPAERDPHTGRLGRDGAGPGSRQHKDPQDERPHPRRAGRLLVAAAAAVLLVVVVAVALAAAGGEDEARAREDGARAEGVASTSAAAGVPVEGTWELQLDSERLPTGEATDRVLTQEFTGDCDGIGPCSTDIGMGAWELVRSGTPYTHREVSSRTISGSPDCPPFDVVIEVSYTFDLSDPAAPTMSGTFLIDPTVYEQPSSRGGTCTFTGERGTITGRRLAAGEEAEAATTTAATSSIPGPTG